MVRQVEIENYVFMLILYILCFVYLFKVNTEYICFILLLILNLFYILIFLSDIEGTSNVEIFTLEIPIRIIILILWFLLIYSNSWFINTFDKLRRKFNNETGAGFGTPNYNAKNLIKIYLVLGSILLILLHLVSVKDIPTIIPTNSVKILLSVSGIMITCFSFGLNSELSSYTKILTQ